MSVVRSRQKIVSLTSVSKVVGMVYARQAGQSIACLIKHVCIKWSNPSITCATLKSTFASCMGRRA